MLASPYAKDEQAERRVPYADTRAWHTRMIRVSHMSASAATVLGLTCGPLLAKAQGKKKKVWGGGKWAMREGQGELGRRAWVRPKSSIFPFPFSDFLFSIFFLPYYIQTSNSILDYELNYMQQYKNTNMRCKV